MVLQILRRFTLFPESIFSLSACVRAEICKTTGLSSNKGYRLDPQKQECDHLIQSRTQITGQAVSSLCSIISIQNFLDCFWALDKAMKRQGEGPALWGLDFSAHRWMELEKLVFGRHSELFQSKECSFPSRIFSKTLSCILAYRGPLWKSQFCS